MKQVLDAVVLGFADRLIETAQPASRSDNVPQPNSPFGKPLEPPFVIERLKVFADRCAEQSPELIGRMRIVSLRRERGVARQAAKDEQAGIAPRDRGEAGFDAHG